MPVSTQKGGPGLSPGGLHHFMRNGHRIHLRVDPEGNGILTVDASRIIHLNKVAADMAWMILSEFSHKEALAKLKSNYNAGKKEVENDLNAFRVTLEKILCSGAIEPITFLNIDVREPFQSKVDVPYRMDLALTYRCNLKCLHCYNEAREKSELSSQEWKKVLKIIWDLGVPHVIFTGGEATLRNDLPELIAFAESLGMVTGLLTNGVKLADGDYLQKLVDAGLDHVQVTLESHDAKVHNRMTGTESFQTTVAAIRNCLDAGLHTITNTTITTLNRDGMAKTVRFAHELGLNAIAANAVIHSGKADGGRFAVSAKDLEITMLEMVEELDRLDMRFIWYSPTRYCEFNPLEFSLGPKRCTAGEYNLCVEPDGEVLPCQSWYESAGNILMDSWDSIWNSRLMKAARKRAWVDAECRDCVHFDLCGGGCPLEKKTGVPCKDSM
ncbi:MAG TPA: radical SAM protein [Candidatus Aminicenantes bacterium]|nr:radical SAM protein [Candidatus Aminicenantes bacterium]